MTAPVCQSIGPLTLARGYECYNPRLGKMDWVCAEDGPTIMISGQGSKIIVEMNLAKGLAESLPEFVKKETAAPGAADEVIRAMGLEPPPHPRSTG